MITITMRTATMMAEIVVVVAQNTVANVSVRIQVMLLIQVIKQTYIYMYMLYLTRVNSENLSHI